MTHTYETEIRRLSRTLSEIAHTLESADGVDDRVGRVLTLTEGLVPYRRCALLRAIPGTQHQLFVVPEADPESRQRLHEDLIRLLRLVSHAEEIGLSRGSDPHLTLPVIGLDEVIGLIRLDPSEETSYDAQHLRLLSVVAAQLGAYLTMIRLREEDQQRTQELAAAHEFQRRLLGMVSHDLRNPLGAVTLAAQSLLRSTVEPEKVKVIGRALRSANRATRIINDLLDVTATRVAGEMAVSRKRTDLVGLLNEVVEDLRLVHPEREIRVHVGVADDRIEGEWDPDRLVQAVTNLLNNSIQYGDSQSPIALEVSAHGDRVLVKVANRGPPIPQELLGVIFDPFKQGGREKRRAGGGLGLGLYIVDQIVRAHGGAVSVLSTDAEGTSFTMTLPRFEPAPSREDTSHPTSPSGDAVPLDAHHHRPLVMVVDDDPEVRSGVADLLEAHAYRVVEAANGADALGLLRRGLRPATILVDLNMLVMDGETFCKVCREDPTLSPIPLMIITADAASAVKLTSKGATGFLGKPVRPEELLETVQNLAGH